MTDEPSAVAAGDAAGGPVSLAPESPVETPREPAQPRRSIFDRRSVPPLSPQERAVRTDAIERSLQFGAEPVRDGRGWAQEVDFIEANREAVEPWKHDRRDKRFYRRSQQVAKAAGQLIGQPGDRIELATRFARLHRREGSDVEGAVRRGLFDAIWRFDHVYDSYTVPRRYGTHIMKTGRVAAVAEEARRRWQAEGLAPADAFWVRNRRNTGLVLVSPNADPDALPSEEILGGEGVEMVVGQADIEEAFEPYFPEGADRVPAEHLGTDFGTKQPVRFSYPDLPLAENAAASKTRLLDGSPAPVINLSKDRIANILADEPAVFEIADSPTASGEEPWYAFHTQGYWAVWIHQDLIVHVAEQMDVDPDLVKAVMYVENAHGASYGWIPESLGAEKTTLPMNINPKTWGTLIGDEPDFNDALVNVKAGIMLIQRIQERVKDPTVAKVASPYKFTGQEHVTDYGARVARVYETRAWERTPLGFSDSELNKTPDRKTYLEEFHRRRKELKRHLGSEVSE